MGALPKKLLYGAELPTPNPSAINTGLSALRPATALACLGSPLAAGQPFPVDCTAPTNLQFQRNVVTVSAGPIRVTCHKVMVEPLQAAFRRVKEFDLDLYNCIGTDGCLCVREVRGSRANTPSSHAFGTAVDLRINGIKDEPGDGKTLVGLYMLYSFFHAEGLYWGAEFPTEDSMHFELADETLRRLCGKWTAKWPRP